MYNAKIRTATSSCGKSACMWVKNANTRQLTCVIQLDDTSLTCSKLEILLCGHDMQNNIITLRSRFLQETETTASGVDKWKVLYTDLLQPNCLFFSDGTSETVHPFTHLAGLDGETARRTASTVAGTKPCVPSTSLACG
jgi:hypothetical protein